MNTLLPKVAKRLYRAFRSVDHLGFLAIRLPIERFLLAGYG